eukprot:10008945-Ditylum_brightwellii.AAC.1
MNFDADKFCNYLAETLKVLWDAGGDDNQALLKLYKALDPPKVDAFNSEIRAYRAAVTTKDKLLDFTKLTTMAQADYMSLVMHRQWPKVQTLVSKKRAINDIVALKAALKRKEKIIKSYKSVMLSSSNKFTNRHSNHYTVKEPK